jgi:hypothetical protein
MRQIVLLKAIPDLNEIKIDQGSRKPLTEGVKAKISDLDRRALEAAIQLRDAVGGEVLVLSMGDDKTKTALLSALAMGADSAYIVNVPELKGIDTNATSKVLEAAVKAIGDYDLIVAGEMTLDSLSSQIGPRLAELLGLPQVTYVKAMSVTNGKITATRDLEDVDQVVATLGPGQQGVGAGPTSGHQVDGNTLLVPDGGQRIEGSHDDHPPGVIRQPRVQPNGTGAPGDDHPHVGLRVTRRGQSRLNVPGDGLDPIG